MPEWFLRRHLGHAVDCDEWDVIELAFRTLINAARAQPQAFMHRDYHSRNLLVVDATTPADAMLANPGIIDFQGAMVGPITYDLASLLRDCYIAWDAERVEGWLESLSPAPAPRASDRYARRRRALSPLVRSRRTAAPHQGARHLLPALVSRRQARTISPTCR